MKKFILIPLILIVAACSSTSDKKIDRAARAYVDNLIVEEKYSAKPDTVNLLKDEVFKKYSFTKEDYKQFFDELSADKVKWDKFFSSAEKYLDSLKAEKKLK